VLGSLFTLKSWDSGRFLYSGFSKKSCSSLRTWNSDSELFKQFEKNLTKLAKRVLLVRLREDSIPCDAALLGLDFVKELAVDPEVNDPVKLVMDVDHCPEPSDLAGRLGEGFRKLL
jgi:hypothetical protein